MQTGTMLCRPLGTGAQHLSMQHPGVQLPKQGLAGHSHKGLSPLDHADIEDHADFGWHLLVAIVILIDGTLLLSGLLHAVKGSQSLCSKAESVLIGFATMGKQPLQWASLCDGGDKGPLQHGTVSLQCSQISAQEASS